MGKEKTAPEPLTTRKCFEQCMRRLDRLGSDDERTQVLNALTAMGPVPPQPRDPRQLTLDKTDDPFSG